MSERFYRAMVRHPFEPGREGRALFSNRRMATRRLSTFVGEDDGSFSRLLASCLGSYSPHPSSVSAPVIEVFDVLKLRFLPFLSMCLCS
jgi:hypothetical protein